MALDFPASPNTGDSFVGSNGITYTWDGVKWVATTVSGSGSFLPIAGGTMLGPLNWTATGSITSRSAQDRSSDAVNVRDYGAVGDGATIDTQAFQAAIATGHVIHVPRGTYLVGPLILNQAMYGDGMDATILLYDPSAPPDSNFITWRDPGPSTIRDLTIDGNNRSSNGINAGGVAGGQVGLRIEDVECRFLGQLSPTGGGKGIILNWDQTDANALSSCVVTNCYVHDIWGAGITAGGYLHVIANNTVTNCGHSGIDCWGAMIDSVIADNTIYNTGFNLAASSDGITGYGYQNLRVLIVGNTVSDSTNHAIHLGGNNIQISNNKIFNVINGSGIILQASPNDAPTPGANGIISGNEIDTVAVGSGIRCGWFSRVVVTGNTVSNTGGSGNNAGISFVVSSDCVASDNIVTNNSVGSGIQAAVSPNLIVNGNRISNVAGSGILDVYGDSTGMLAYGNIISGEGTPTVPRFASSPWLPTVGGQLTGGLSFSTPNAPSPSTLTSHLALNASNGLSLTAGRMNVVAQSATYFLTNTGDRAWIDNYGLNMSPSTDIYLARNATSGMQAVTFQQLQTYLPLAGGSMTGAIQQYVSGGQLVNYVGADSGVSLIITNGPAGGNLQRWRWYLGAGTETGGNTGQDIFIRAFADDGTTSLLDVMQMFRGTGRVFIRRPDLGGNGETLSFFGVAPVGRQSVTGAGGGNTALASLLTALTNLGLITNNSVP